MTTTTVDKKKKLEIWESVEKTDQDFTKQFNRPGGFSGTSINSTYLIRKATALFGPMGLGWGVEIVDEQYRDGAILGLEKESGLPIKAVVHVLRVRLWYKHNGETGEVFHFGQTPFVYATSKGIRTDEEAPKKSLTDATTKALSMLGFGGDIFIGLFDDFHYRAEAQEEIRAREADEDDEKKKELYVQYTDWKERLFGQLKTARSLNELTLNHRAGLRKMERWKTASGTGDVKGMREAEDLYQTRKTQLEAEKAAAEEKSEGSEKGSKKPPSKTKDEE